VKQLELGDNRRITDAAGQAILADGRVWARVGLEGTGVSEELQAEITANCRRDAEE
jgi:hypothetical protein